MFERAEEILLEPEIREFSFLDEFHRQLSERIDSEFRDFFVRTTADGVEQFAQDLPDSRPLETDAAHIVVRDFHEFLQREHPGPRAVRQLLRAYLVTILGYIDSNSSNINNSMVYARE